MVVEHVVVGRKTFFVLLLDNAEEVILAITKITVMKSSPKLQRLIHFQSEAFDDLV